MRPNNASTLVTRPADQKPLVLLDVDGVINDLGSLQGQTRSWGIEIVHSNGFSVHVPDYMPTLVRKIADVAEILWCTTWRHRANDEIASHLGVGPFPVVDDGTERRVTSWKPAAAYDVATRALDAGRRVIWIEDFYGLPPVAEMPIGTEFIDTAVDRFDAVLTLEMVASLLSVADAA